VFVNPQTGNRIRYFRRPWVRACQQTGLVTHIFHDFRRTAKNRSLVDLLKVGKWAGAELNRRHEDFQSSALPTELPAHRWEINDLASVLLKG
jgi:hypothetical protein